MSDVSKKARAVVAREMLSGVSEEAWLGLLNAYGQDRLDREAGPPCGECGDCWGCLKDKNLKMGVIIGIANADVKELKSNLSAATKRAEVAEGEVSRLNDLMNNGMAEMRADRHRKQVRDLRDKNDTLTAEVERLDREEGAASAKSAPVGSGAESVRAPLRVRIRCDGSAPNSLEISDEFSGRVLPARGVSFNARAGELPSLFVDLAPSAFELDASLPARMGCSTLIEDLRGVARLLKMNCPDEADYRSAEAAIARWIEVFS